MKKVKADLHMHLEETSTVDDLKTLLVMCETQKLKAASILSYNSIAIYQDGGAFDLLAKETNNDFSKYFSGKIIPAVEMVSTMDSMHSKAGKDYEGYRSDIVLYDFDIEKMSKYLGEEELMTYTGAYTYEVDADCTMVYTGLAGNYICSIQIVYPAAKENASITFGSEGNYKTSSAINMSGMNVRDNGGNNSQLSSGSMTITVYAGATVTVHGYPNYTSYTISDGVNTTAEINDAEYTYTVEADGELIITAVNSNNYFYGIDITSRT